MKKIILISSFLYAILLGNIGNEVVYAKQPVVVCETFVNAVPYSINYEWVYAIIDGVMCRRLYDKTNQCWVGDWEPCP